MPKIGKQTIRIDNDKTEQFYDIEIFYNQDYHFYIEVPSMFNQVFDLMDDTKRKKLSAYKKFKHKYDQAGDFKRIVTGSTEKESVENLISLVKNLMLQSFTTREVIVIAYDGRTETHDYQVERSAYLSLEFIYCTETQIAGNKPIYYQYREYEAFGKIDKSRSRVDLRYGGDHIIIDSTKENREFLEMLDNNLKTLIEKLKKFTESPESLLQLIASKQNLLPQPPNP